MNRRQFFAVVPAFVLPVAMIGCATADPNNPPTRDQIAARIRAIAHLTSYLAATGVKVLAGRKGPEELADAIKKLRQARHVADDLLLSDTISLGVLANALKAAGIIDANSPQGDLKVIIIDALQATLLIVDVYGWVQFDPDIEYHARAAIVGVRDGLFTAVGPGEAAVNQETARDLEAEAHATEYPFVQYWNRVRR